MKKTIIFLFAMLIIVVAWANDGVFYAKGNQLIPIAESDISVKKEILTITKDGDFIKVNVYYEFYNPIRTKDLLVGFEALAPDPFSQEDMKKFPEHPHIRNFKVVMNGQPLGFEVAHVDAGHWDNNGNFIVPDYYVNGKLNEWSRQQCYAAAKDIVYDSAPFNYVYHFNAHFNEGVNTIQHTYDFEIGEDTEVEWGFPYVLTAANRWANNGIDDFTLRINMGQHESFQIPSYFFKDGSEWHIEGKGKVNSNAQSNFYAIPCPMFHLQDGYATFHKKHFHPDGELYVYKPFQYALMWGENPQEWLDAFRVQYFDFANTMYNYYCCANSMDADQCRIMKNMPFAYRGYVFKNQDLQRYFESTDWYVPNPNYVSDMTTMSEDEKIWIRFWTK